MPKEARTQGYRIGKNTLKTLANAGKSDKSSEMALIGIKL